VYSEKGKGKQLLWKVLSAVKEGEEPEAVFVVLEENDQLNCGVPFSLTVMTAVVFK